MAKHIISLSGGKDSTAMVIGMIEKSYLIDDIVCVDTTKEFPEMYPHLEKLNEYLKDKIGMEITFLSFDFDYYFKDHIKQRGKNKGQKGYGWAEPGIMWCTTYKKNTINQYLNKQYPLY